MQTWKEVRTIVTEPLTEVLFAKALELALDKENMDVIGMTLHWFNKRAKDYRETKNLCKIVGDTEGYEEAYDNIKSIYRMKDAVLSSLYDRGLIKPVGIQKIPSEFGNLQYGYLYNINGYTFHTKSIKADDVGIIPYLGKMKYQTTP